MKKLLVSLSAVMLLAIGCGPPPLCDAAAEPASVCANVVTVRVRDSANAPVSVFSGSLTEGTNTQAVACGVPSDAGTSAACLDGGFSFFATQREAASFQATLTAGDAGFSGTVPIEWERATAPANSCGGHCSRGTATVSLP